MRLTGHVRRGRTGGDRQPARLAAMTVGNGWVWPWWLQRQLDPRSPAFVVDPAVNVTARNWTAIGNIASPRRAIVDPRGLVTPWAGGWSLDWWIGAEDRWHFPSQETAVRQGLVGTAPVVETLMRIPSGDAVARTYTVVGDSRVGDLVVVEVENSSPAPVAVAFAVRPFNTDGLATIDRVEIIGPSVIVDGNAALLLPRPPASWAARAAADGDIAAWVSTGAGSSERDAADCPAGLASAAVVFPLPHRAIIRVAMPLAADVVERNVDPGALFTAAAVARAWDTQARRGLRVALPGGRLADVFDINRKYILEAFAADRVVTSPSRPDAGRWDDATAVLGALDRLGFHAETADVLRGLPDRQHFRGSFDHDPTATGAALHAVADHWRLSRDVSVLEHALPAVALGARWLARSRSPHRDGGLMPTAVAPPQFGASAHLYRDTFWALRGLLDAAELLEAGANDRAAKAGAAEAEALRADLMHSLDDAAARLGTRVIPAGADRSIDAAVVGSLLGCEPLRVMAADDQAVVATVAEIRARYCSGPAVMQSLASVGLSPVLTAQLAAVELAAGDRGALERLAWLVDVASPTATWPDAIHPTVHGGSAGEGHSLVAAAAFIHLVRDLLVTEVDDGLAVLRLLPDGWVGQSIDVRDAPTAWGKVSYAVRWHGRRPALLWSVVAHDGVGPVRVRAPGLDPTWSSDEREGEALLSEIA